ncbi:hypothetical protein P691DRAFT_759015 [Macrolepiota fuliginosa MF-IS2]|uniref:Uncharacterized protein n=1 Tax=Macrolepiota fuliginosa MF-IS2 TaxID=1400762 RepID=A0A9P5XED3_9AGAR|nr:hypothetical protein P691DRAFT_759015 [Macrolepiota fuliginosa MF-IS2]
MALISFSEPPSSQGHPTDSSRETPPKTKENVQPDVSNQAPQATSKLPVVALDVDVLTDTIAARLATSLLGHVLFLKNQIPLPIVQLARMSSKKNNTKAAKLKADLLSSYDILASHLVTTFSALSTALAKSASSEVGATGRIYLAILVGPSLGTAKSRVFYGVDQFAIHVWGKRGDPTDGDRSGEGGSGDELPDDSDTEGETESETESEGAESSNGDDAECSSEGEAEDEDEDQSTDEERADGDGNTDEDVKQENANNYSPPAPSIHKSFAEEQRFLQTADRLFSRTLASADADGHAISNEMPPSQTHILIRAPRRFVHPAWIPRQNVTKQMEAGLTDFLEESWPSASKDNRPLKKKKPVEGVWLTARNGLGSPTQDEASPDHDDNEMIWWSWDGKLVGFADW